MYDSKTPRIKPVDAVLQEPLKSKMAKIFPPELPSPNLYRSVARNESLFIDMIDMVLPRLNGPFRIDRLSAFRKLPGLCYQDGLGGMPNAVSISERPASVEDRAVHSQAKLSAVARQLNERPRKTLGFETPAARLNECVASTG